MYALITGASSGIGKEIAKILSKEYDLILVSRDLNKLNELKNELKCNVEVISLDLSIKENHFKLYELYKDYDIDILVNNAGFGKIEFYDQSDILENNEMINLNVLCVYNLTILFSKIVKSHILNVSSLAGFIPGPKMANYYATKSYVLSFSRAINYELKKKKSNLRISILAPGPVKTNFNKRAKGDFKIKGLDPYKLSIRCIKKMKLKKEIIYGSFKNSLMAFFSKIIPHRFLLFFIYKNQNSK